jgi:tryptophanase
MRQGVLYWLDTYDFVMAIDDDVKITINLNELVEIRAKLISQYDNYSDKVSKGEYLDGGDIDRIATGLRDTLTWDTLYSMVDDAVLDYLGIKETHYGERTIETIELTMEKERKEREKEFKKNFDLVKLESPSWTLEIPMRKKK